MPSFAFVFATTPGNELPESSEEDPALKRADCSLPRLAGRGERGELRGSSGARTNEGGGVDSRGMEDPEADARVESENRTYSPLPCDDVVEEEDVKGRIRMRGFCGLGLMTCRE